MGLIKADIDHSVINICTYNYVDLSVAGLPDPFAKVDVVGSKQWCTTKTCQATLNPDWNQQFHV